MLPCLQLYSLQDSMSSLLEYAHQPIRGTVLEKIVQTICRFIDGHAHIIFWSGCSAALIACPITFFWGFTVGFAVADFTAPTPGKTEFKGAATPLQKASQLSMWAITRLLPLPQRSLINGYSPGYLLYRLYTGQYYPNRSGLQAIWHEIEWVAFEAAQWFAFPKQS